MAVRSTLRRIGSKLSVLGRPAELRQRVEATFGRTARAEPAPPEPPPPAAPAAAPPIAAPPVAAPEPAGPPPLTAAQVEVVLEEMVRPALQSDGGDITLIKVENNDVYVALRGACETCPSSIVTMQDGIARLLAEEFPQFGQLVRVDG